MNGDAPATANYGDAQIRRRVAHGPSARGDYIISASVVGVLSLISIWWSEPVAHWFLLPAMACGILAGVDIVRWLRGRLDIFDPRTIVGCLAFYGFFVAPILHVAWDRFGAGYDLILFGDWRPWLAATCGLSAAGLIAYKIAHNWTFASTRPSPTRWQIDAKRFYPVFAFALILSVAGTVVYLWQLGGILGEVESFENNVTAFTGTGWLLIFAWPLTILSSIVFVFAWNDRHGKTQRHMMTALLVLGAAGIGHFLMMGWYGSRSATIWALFWMVGIVHYRFRRFSPATVALGVILVIGFLYFYGFYKERGRAGFEVLQSPSTWLSPKGYQRDLKGLLLGDLARADIDAFILHNLVKDPGDYDYRLGLTYLGGPIILIPRYFWPDRPEYKVDAGTEAQFGKITPWRSSRVYGLSGEALLNFGPFGVIPMFGLFGTLLGWYRRKLISWDVSDSRMFLAPLFAILLASALISDSDNLVYAFITDGMLVCCAIFAASRRFSLNQAAPTHARSSHK